jgi:hypothetical protein
MAFDLKLADDGEPSRSDTAAIVAAFVVGGAAAFVAPHLKRLWVESLAPAATRGVSQIRWRLRGCSDSLSS